MCVKVIASQRWGVFLRHGVNNSFSHNNYSRIVSEIREATYEQNRNDMLTTTLQLTHFTC